MESEAGKSVCDRCGKEAAGEIGEEMLCEDRYHGASAGCGRFCDEDA